MDHVWGTLVREARQCVWGRIPAGIAILCGTILVLIMGEMPSRCSAQEAQLSSPEHSWMGPGGRHEFGASTGGSFVSGHIWGAADKVYYTPVHLRYSFEFHRHNQQWTLRYAPEITALARISWLQPDEINNVVSGQSPRLHTYGSGFSPVGFQADFRPLKRAQPYFMTNSGFVYFADRVLSPQGSQWMYTIDFGAGVNIFHHRRSAVSVGYRYQHLSNANISFHNPGMDANTIYIGVSRFRSWGE